MNFLFVNLGKTTTLIALIIAAFAIVLLFMARRIAEKIMANKFHDSKPEDPVYKDKLLSLTLVLKGIAAGLAVAACVLSLF
jgi:uncharacterized BrkB/YihY/UPF0761 family membrane protein